jgi:hypothetical protein
MNIHQVGFWQSHESCAFFGVSIICCRCAGVLILAKFFPATCI